MKKFISILFFLILIFCFTNVKAADYYEIKIPNSFKKEGNINYYLKEENNQKISILIHTEKNSRNLNLNNYTEENIEDSRYIDKLKEEFNSLGYNINITSSNVYLTNINNYPMLVMDVISSYKLESESESIVYQRQYITSSKNYIYYITISSSNNKYLSSEESQEIISTFKIKDELLTKTNDIVLYYIVLSIIVVVGIGLGFMFSKKKI